MVAKDGGGSGKLQKILSNGRIWIWIRIRNQATIWSSEFIQAFNASCNLPVLHTDTNSVLDATLTRLYSTMIAPFYLNGVGMNVLVCPSSHFTPCIV